MHLKRGFLAMLSAFCLMMVNTTFAQVPTPESHFGFQVGADYKLFNHQQQMDYFQKLDAASDRVLMKEIGKTTLGKPMVVVFISSEDNIKNLEKYRKISEDLARVRVDEATARKYSEEGKAIIWIDGGLHATERAGAQMTPELAYRVATEETSEMKKIREEVIFILMPSMNPDGLNIVENWYKKQLGTPWETTNPPWLYHHFIGHDNNRDWFMNNMPESYHVNEVLYNEWYPQIVYNQHQTSPGWARIFLPPFDNPVNPNIHPGATTGTNLVGTAMANRFALERKPGVISNHTFSMWWNGGMRTVPYFHNMIGILTETGHATPTPRFYDPDSIPKYIRGLGGSKPTDGTHIFYSDPWKGGESHFRDAVDYMITGSLAVLDLAADRKEHYLYNIYSMGKDAIEAKLLENSFAYVIPAEQFDKGEARNLVNILRQGGVEMHKATKSFMANGKQYAAGSYIAYSAQAFRPYLVDLMEKQSYPDLRISPGGPPIPPYDLAGWTLPMQMGVTVDKLMEKFTASTEEIKTREPVTAGKVSGKSSYGYSLTTNENSAIKAVNFLLAKGEKVSRLAAKQGDMAAGTFVVKKGGSTDANVSEASKTYGVDFAGLAAKPAGTLKAIKLPKVGLYKTWQANMDEGWTRWLLQDYGFPLDTLHDNDVRTKDLSQYDAIIIPDQRPDGILNGYSFGFMPPEYTGGMGIDGLAAIKNYVANGGQLITFDEASDFAVDQFGLSLRSTTNGLSPNTFFIPGSLIRTNVDTNHSLAYGVQAEVAASFNQSRAYSRVVKDNEGEGGKEPSVKEAPEPPLEIVGTYAKDKLLMSGWAMGQDKYIGSKAAVIKAGYGSGSIVLFAFRPQFRGQPRATYKLIFNAIYEGTME
ncbi:MAG: M14 family metallopeptidase [Imperialibacter sp.]|uniref:M14 family metallopeptidase n=1 Tax=Imperialibacter sp. TaxID=2038411 RepID=UPI0032ED79D3